MFAQHRRVSCLPICSLRERLTLPKFENPCNKRLHVVANDVLTFSRAPWLMVWVGSIKVASPEWTPASSTCSVIAWTRTWKDKCWKWSNKHYIRKMVALWDWIKAYTSMFIFSQLWYCNSTIVCQIWQFLKVNVFMLMWWTKHILDINHLQNKFNIKLNKVTISSLVKNHAPAAEHQNKEEVHSS